MALINFTEATSNTLTLAHTLGKASSPDRVVLVGLAADQGESSNPSMSYNGVPGVQVYFSEGHGAVGAEDGAVALWAWRNANLPAGAGAFNATLAWGAGSPSPWRFYVATFDDFDQSLVPVQTVPTNITSGGPPNTTINRLSSRSTVVDFLYSRNDATSRTPTAGNTKILGKSSGTTSFHASARPPAESNSFGQAVTMGWGSGSGAYRHQVVFEFASYQGHKAIMLGTNF